MNDKTEFRESKLRSFRTDELILLPTKSLEFVAGPEPDLRRALDRFVDRPATLRR